jgi:hypothetical protein
VSSADEVVEALNLGDEPLAKMARHARQRTLEEHSGDCRARQLINYLEESAGARGRQDSMEVAS